MPQSIVDITMHSEHFEVRFEQCDSREEAGALQSVAIQLLRRHVGGDYEGHALPKQRAE